LNRSKVDALVVGAGFYGASIACYLSQVKKFKRVLLVEKESSLFLRASYNNQARIHNGYHYPRSFTTAYRSRVNMPRFLEDWNKAAYTSFLKLYAVPKRNTNVTAKQFLRFSREIGAKIKVAAASDMDIFDTRLVDTVYECEEYAFDSKILAEMMSKELENSGVEVLFDTEVSLIKSAKGGCNVTLFGEKEDEVVEAKYVFNCTYSGLNIVRDNAVGGTQLPLKHEIAELALVKVPQPLENIGLTVMDGPFFSLMPFPSKGLHTLTHVRYTPHFAWVDDGQSNPYKVLENYPCQTRVDRMIRDASRYVPCIKDVTYTDSLFEIKTVLLKNETDDGRPILYERNEKQPRLFSVLGGKIDNIYDIFERLDREVLS
jgi:glycine/D-amino acid oxidase-like deaminating enzyme